MTSPHTTYDLPAPIEIRLDTGETRSYETGSLYVPADHDAPAAGTLKLVYARLRSPHPGRRPVVFLSGGPGDSAVQWLRHGPFRRVFERVAETRDVILLDQRGCGASETDLRCPPADLRAGWLSSARTAFAMLEDQAARFYANRPAGDRPSHYTPWQSARDLGCVADALGVEKIDLWGYSYGTHLVQAALKAAPGRIGRAVLCGFEGPDQTYKLPSRIQAQLRRIAALAASQDACADLMDLMARVHDRLDKASVTVTLADGSPVEVGLFGLQWIAASWAGLSNRFVRMPALYSAFDRGDATQLETAVRGFTKMLAQRTAAFYLNDSASGATADRLKQIASEQGDCLLGNAFNFPFPGIRAAWQQVDLGGGFRQPLATRHPLFVLTGSLDGFTPTENALESLTTLPHAIHREIANAAHNDLLGCPEAVEDAIRFLQDTPVSAGGYAIAEPRFPEVPSHQ